MPDCFEIRLNDNSYFPGQTIHGTVQLQLDRTTIVSGIELTCKGRAKVRFAEGNAKQKSTYRNEVNYMNYQVYLLGGPEGTDNINLLPASKEFVFQIPIPANIPSSFNGPYGNVTYTIRATLKTGLWKSNLTATVPVTVHGIVDLNTWPGARDSVQFEEIRPLSSFCGSSKGTISLGFKLARISCVPGEAFNFVMDVNTPKAGRMSVSLIQATEYFGTTFYMGSKSGKSETHVACNWNGPEVKKGEASGRWEGRCQLPAVPPTGLGGCAIMKVAYTMKVKFLTVKGVSVKRWFPVVIGTIPLVTLPGNPAERTYFPVPSAPSTTQLEDNPDLPPPTYEEVTKHLGGELSDYN